MAGRPLEAARGYNLVTLVVLIAVMSVLAAALLPAWEHYVQRQKEEELIARGVQIAEAIRVFQTRNGRLPVRLEELLEVEPRSIRQLWKDPMTESGKWDLILQGAEQGTELPGSGEAPGDTPGEEDEEEDAEEDGTGLDGETVTVGPIRGVRSHSEEESILVFFGRQQHDQWEFTPEIFEGVVSAEGSPRTPRLGYNRLGKPFPPDLQPQGGGAPTPVEGGDPGDGTLPGPDPEGDPEGGEDADEGGDEDDEV